MSESLLEQLRDESTVDPDISVPADLIVDPVTGQITTLLQALAAPVLRGEAGGSLTAGVAAGSYLCNMDSTPKLPATLANQVLSLFKYIPELDDPPPGFKTQWGLEVGQTTNATAPAQTITWGMWNIQAIGGGAGGYTETMAGTFTLPNFNSTIFATHLTVGFGGWVDTDSAGAIASSGIPSAPVYGFAIFLPGAMAAGSALRWRMRLYRRWIPIPT